MAPNSPRARERAAAIVTMSAIAAASVNAFGPAGRHEHRRALLAVELAQVGDGLLTWSRRSEAVP